MQADAIKLLETEAITQWSDAPYPLALDDRPFKPTEQHTIFVRHSVVFGDGLRVALGTGWYRYPGMQYLSIFYRGGAGNASVYTQADAIMTYYTDHILRNADVNVVFEIASTIKLPKDTNGFNQVQVVCPFYFDTRS